MGKVRSGRQKAQAKKIVSGQAKLKTVDYLTEDPTIPGQKFCCLSFASIGEEQTNQHLRSLAIKFNDYIMNYHKTNTNSLELVKKLIGEYSSFEKTKRAVKVRGSYEDINEANKRADLLRNVEPEFHIFTAQVGLWLPFDPNPDSIQDENYVESEINELVKGHKINRLKSKVYFEQRKREMMEKAIQEGTEEGQEILKNTDEPVEAVEQRIKCAEEAVKEWNEKIEEAKRTQKLAEEKLAHMKEKIENGYKYPTMEEYEKSLNDYPSVEELEKIEIDETELEKLAHKIPDGYVRSNADKVEKIKELRTIVKEKEEFGRNPSQQPGDIIKEDDKIEEDTPTNSMFGGSNIVPSQARKIIEEEFPTMY